jgi:hypothetical protein
MVGSIPIPPTNITYEMTNQEIYDLYVLQSKNVRKLKKVESNLVRTINLYIKKKDEFQVELNTKLYALVYCTLSESQFIQIVHTPNGFLFSEIQKIKIEKKGNVVKAWELLFDLAFNKVNADWKNNHDLIQRRKQIQDILDNFIKKPSELRNKIAHGQWDFALNSDNTKENQVKTLELQNLDVIKISIWSEVHQYLGLIVRDLIQSPKSGFHRNYWTNLTNLENYVSKSSTWTIEKRIAQLRPVP